MKRYYNAAERLFESLSEKSLFIFGNSITFIIVCILVLYWTVESFLLNEAPHDLFRDILVGVSFLNFFIIQKSFNKYSKALHVKLNELVLTNERASNEMVNAELKTEQELESIRKKHETEASTASESSANKE
jgi:low affinity Fe/Cu permease